MTGVRFEYSRSLAAGSIVSLDDVATSLFRSDDVPCYFDDAAGLTSFGELQGHVEIAAAPSLRHLVHCRRGLLIESEIEEHGREPRFYRLDTKTI